MLAVFAVWPPPQYVVEEFGEVVFSNLLSYLMTGSCSILPSTVVGLACAAERYEVAELKQACFERLPDCLSIGTVCSILSGLERYLSFGAAKTMIVRCLEFVDSNAADILSSRDFLALSENLVHLVLRRDGASEAGTALPEVLKVKAAFAWGERHAKPGSECVAPGAHGNTCPCSREQLSLAPSPTRSKQLQGIGDTTGKECQTPPD